MPLVCTHSAARSSLLLYSAASVSITSSRVLSRRSHYPCSNEVISGLALFVIISHIASCNSVSCALMPTRVPRILMHYCVPKFLGLSFLLFSSCAPSFTGTTRSSLYTQTWPS
ncbi:hypothetical protein BKA81DRAFT_123918 [Phyllosticta paracitricarpa]|uniref:Uncharacterized protein n=1 Tax=Phyllosticta paracitricarpa TaxID=2016321 RepID=A0ABR1N2J7_9PEZI